VQDLEDANQETHKAFWSILRRREIMPEDYLPLGLALARRKGLRALGLRGCRTLTNADALLAAATAGLPHGLAGPVRREPTGPAECDELCQQVLKLVQGLPPRQRIITDAYLRNYDEFEERKTFTRLAKLVSGITGQPENVETIKSNLHAGRAVLRVEVARRYPGLFGSNAP
jgi:hypothetical protein